MELPHRPPWLLVDRVRERGDAFVVAEKLLSTADPLVGGALPELLVVEALAQAAALCSSATLGSHHGLLVAAKEVRFESRACAGERLTLRVERQAVRGTLHQFDAVATVAERLVARGQLTFALLPEPR